MKTRTSLNRRILSCGLPVALVVTIVLAAPSRAAEIPPQELIVAVETWVRHVTADARPDAVVELLEPYGAGELPAAYVAHLAGGGYCICGADDRLLPVYLYNPSGRFDASNPSYQAILRDIAMRLEKLDAAFNDGDPVLSEYQPALAERAEQWLLLASGQVPTSHTTRDRTDPVTMELTLACAWRQGSPYNDYCPELTPGVDEHMIVGCVGTAMAQIMYYWQWPNSGVASQYVDFTYRYSAGGAWLSEPLATDPNVPASWPWSGRLRWVPTDGGTLQMNGWWENSIYDGAREISSSSSYRAALDDLWDRLDRGWAYCPADFGAATYDWSSMPEAAGEPPGTGGLEAAEISYHAAVSVQMDFGLLASSAFQSPFPYYTFFRYDPDARSNTRFDSYIVDDIQWLRVVQLRGEDERGGHSWVVAGYNKSTTPWQYLMNMGWGGGTTDWYSCDDVFPEDQHIVTRIAPRDIVRFVAPEAFGGGGDGTPSDPYLGLAYALQQAPDDTTLILKAGTSQTLTGTSALLERPMTLKGHDVWIERGVW